MNFYRSKRFTYWFLALIAMFTLLSGCAETKKSEEMAGSKEKEIKTIRIGYQKNGPLIILKSLGTLEKTLGEKGISVEWKEFQAGPALVEALNAGTIDFGRTGDSPPIFAQAAGAPFVYVAAGKPKFNGSAILVKKDSPIKSVKDLKGKTVGFAKGSSSHYLIIKGLEKAGLAYGDIVPAFLAPGDGRVAFEQGQIDAWVVWDPFTSAAEIGSGARMLVNGEGLTTDRDFFLASTTFSMEHPQIIKLILDEVQHSLEWANSHHEELVGMLAPILKIDEQSLEVAVKRRVYGVDEIDGQIIQEQQEIADTFYTLGIIPKKIDVRDAMKK
ncbi:aliphatic sulfonate ABC transporter substrate-binding protein [Neobacillus piezotolerans]|uniref:Putative aliphatic sulfonates-binding protein n=1 Tax=Neobacillus piezotolerans TaxID=2259171 RepID=A0A3D8GQ21_9BACI|nr:sulfonate ABC transporter substrate-binding protein [Neobacillus piezotolerans]RDU36595.1 aliphatic sulfonate ABC transporter substrate-binding protein [Neobacillus piezotolerans]